MAIDVYWGSGSPYSWRVLLALEHKELPYNSHLLSLDMQEHKAPHMLALNPRGRVPTLKDGDYVVFESLAVMYYLDRKYPAKPLFGESPEEGAVIMRVCCEFQAYIEDHVMRVARAVLMRREDSRSDLVTNSMLVAAGEARTIEMRLSKGDWIVGDRPGAADYMIYPCIRLLMRALARPEARDLSSRFMPVEANYPALARWLARVESLPGFEPHIRRTGGNLLPSHKDLSHFPVGGNTGSWLVPSRPVLDGSMMHNKIHIEFPGRLIFIGFGSIGQGTLPLVLRHIGIPKERITIIAADDHGKRVAESYGVKFVNLPLTRDNFRRELDQYIGRGDFVLNVSVDVSSIALVKLCWSKGAMYLDTCIEPWPGGYTDATIPHARRTNYALREEALALRKESARAPTAVLTHGANPGLVSHFVKQALLNVAGDTGVDAGNPASRDDWGQLARKLGIKVIHIAERDTQLAAKPKEFNEFVNTWSVDGFVSEGQQPAELGWGTHEKNFPRDGKRYDFGNGSSIYLMQPGAATRVRTWTPRAGHFHGFLITHGEAISIADYLSVRQSSEVVYRPTVHYAYHPSDSAVVSVHEFAGRNWHIQDRKRILMDEIISGVDELGVLLAGHKKNAYWYGSTLSIDEARKLAPNNNATSLQVTISCLSGMVWAMENPNAGLVEPDEIDFRRNLEISLPYLGTVAGAYSDWTPLHDRERLFPEDLDKTDPWQFKNVRV